MATNLSCQKNTISIYTGRHFKNILSKEEGLTFQGTKGKYNYLQNYIGGKVRKKLTNLPSHGAKDDCFYLPFNHIKQLKTFPSFSNRSNPQLSGFLLCHQFLYFLLTVSASLRPADFNAQIKSFLATKQITFDIVRSLLRHNYIS